MRAVVIALVISTAWIGAQDPTGVPRLTRLVQVSVTSKIATGGRAIARDLREVNQLPDVSGRQQVAM